VIEPSNRETEESDGGETSDLLAREDFLLMATDNDLVAAAAKGNMRAFAGLSERHLRSILALAQRITGNASDADEVAQEAFLRLWRFAPTWDPFGAAGYDRAERNAKRAYVNGLLQDLPERQRVAVVLSYYEELKGHEIAEAMHLSVKAVESLLVRARRSLRDKLVNQGLMKSGDV